MFSGLSLVNPYQTSPTPTNPSRRTHESAAKDLGARAWGTPPIVPFSSPSPRKPNLVSACMSQTRMCPVLALPLPLLSPSSRTGITDAKATGAEGRTLCVRFLAAEGGGEGGGKRGDQRHAAITLCDTAVKIGVVEIEIGTRRAPGRGSLAPAGNGDEQSSHVADQMGLFARISIRFVSFGEGKGGLPSSKARLVASLVAPVLPPPPPKTSKQKKVVDTVPSPRASVDAAGFGFDIRRPDCGTGLAFQTRRVKSPLLTRRVGQLPR